MNTEKLLNNVFDILDEELRNGYVVMNKYREMPKLIPSDIDLDIHQNDFDNLDKIITNLSKKTGLIITQKIWHHYRKCAYILTPLKIDKPFRLQLDFFSDFSVKNTPLLIPFQEIQSRIRNYGRFTIPDYDIEYVFLLIRRIWKNDFNTSHLALIYDALCGGNKQQIKNYSEQYFGKVNAEIIYNAVLNKHVNQLVLLRDELWINLKKYSRKKSFGLYKVQYKLNEFKRFIYRIRYPIGMSIALLSPDGGGKSTVYKKLEYLCWGSFHNIEKRYFRPRLFKNIGSYNIMNPKEESESNPDPHNVKLDNSIKSLIRFVFYNFDFLFGYFFLIKPLTIKKSLVIFDRYYYDYYVDMQRYKFNLPKWFPSLFQWMIPKPAIVFILNGSAGEFYKRKKELSVKELGRQIAAYYKLSLQMKNSYLIDANQDVSKVSKDITYLLHGVKAEKTALAMGNSLDEFYIPK